MAIKILKKKKANSNKVKIAGKTSLKPDQNAAKNQTDTSIPKPFLDRISVIVEVPSVEDGKAIHDEIWKHIEDEELFAAPKGLSKSSKFDKAKRIPLDSVLKATSWPHFQWASDMGIAKRLRIEFVPVDLGVAGLLELHAALVCLIPNGWRYFIDHGRITRLDVAVDVPTARMSDLHFMPKKGLTTSTWKVNGKLESVYLGKRKGNQTRIYDRGKKRDAKKTSGPGKVGVRIERQLINQNIWLNELYALANPFEALTVVKRYTGPPPSEKKTYIWELMLNAAEHTGLPAALGLVPEDKRATYKTHLKANAVGWWDVDAIWAQWPAMLDELAIAAPKKWI